MAKRNYHIKGFDELRAIAAVGVMVSHIELYKHREGDWSLFQTFLIKFISGLGKNMVDVFFVLSGFLITYLLLVEMQKNGRIAIRKFYIRRVLRIWPLYYLITLISFLIIPNIVVDNEWFFSETYYYNLIVTTDYGKALPYFLFFLSNVALVLRVLIPGASQSWSISVEEQFYAFWPWVIQIFKNYLVLFFLVFILLKILLNNFDFFVGLDGVYRTGLNVVRTIRIEMMALGALGAYYCFNENASLKNLLTRRGVGFFILIMICIMLMFDMKGLHFGALVSLFLCALFFNQQQVKTLQPIAALGQISYGIYMFHPLVIFFVFSILHKLELSSLALNLLAYMIIPLATFGISKLSYLYFETYFLGLKNRLYRMI